MDRIRRLDGTPIPTRRKELRGTNRSYVFFRVTGLSGENEPVGRARRSAHARPLDRGRPGRMIYGTPFFIEAELPIESATPATKFRRLMIAQDTGSAIIGPARADLYFGAGDDAGASPAASASRAVSSCSFRALSTSAKPSRSRCRSRSRRSAWRSAGDKEVVKTKPSLKPRQRPPRHCRDHGPDKASNDHDCRGQTAPAAPARFQAEWTPVSRRKARSLKEAERVRTQNRVHFLLNAL